MKLLSRLFDHRIRCDLCGAWRDREDIRYVDTGIAVPDEWNICLEHTATEFKKLRELIATGSWSYT